jgi:hypothetical protein
MEETTNTMEAVLPILSEWMNRLQIMNWELDKLTALTRGPIYLHDACWRLASAYTAEVERRVGDTAHWLEWWSVEAQFGLRCGYDQERPLLVWIAGEEEPRRILTLHDLARLIVERAEEDA